uniref:IMS import disulfide relay-system CHCH-CHCH-like Cx9C domain-containing protein n=1 Tax=Lotus japonicus TaxID=34305 RepID=I3SFD3_LOTJA|nr:unknown [Lotus japonicus]
MGRKAGGLYINPKRLGQLHKPCMKEMTMFLNCMATCNSDINACAQQKELLNACIDSQSKKKRNSWGSINYQLQRLSRGRK